jgi:signal peptidase I
MRPRRSRKLLSGALGLIVLALVWYYLAPLPLGGSTSYVVTHGISMEPHFHTGDLAVVRSQGSYHVGEIVAYHSDILHRTVLHRIIARDGSRYVFKGDNNDFIDPEHPAASQLIGALWVHIPRVGGVLQSIRSPALIGVLLAVGVALLSGVAFTGQRRRRRAQRRGGEGAGRSAPQPVRLGEGAAGAVLALGLLALIPFCVLALLAFTRAPTASLPVTSPYKQSGTLSYSADAAPGPVYPDGRAATGEPLFTRLIREVEYRYAYNFRASAAHSLRGKAQLYATVTAPSGWRTTLALGRPSYFHQDHTLITGTLDLASLSETISRVQSMTSVRNDSYIVSIAPDVSVSGSLDGQQLHAAFAPAIQFPMTEYEIEPAGAATKTTALSTPSGQQGSSSTNPLAASVSASVQGTRAQTRMVSFGPLRSTVDTARAIALGGIALVLCALAVAAPIVRRRTPRDPFAAARARYDYLIVPVERVWPLPGVPVIDLGDIDALARIAEHYERSILHETHNGAEAFWVTDESGQFRYAPGSGAVTVPDDGSGIGEQPLGGRTGDSFAGEDRSTVPAPSFEHNPATVAVAANVVTEQHWALGYYGQASDDAAPAPAYEDPQRADSPQESEREQARAAFSRSTGLRWSTDS